MQESCPPTTSLSKCPAPLPSEAAAGTSAVAAVAARWRAVEEEEEEEEEEEVIQNRTRAGLEEEKSIQKFTRAGRDSKRDGTNTLSHNAPWSNYSHPTHALLTHASLFDVHGRIETRLIMTQ